MEGVERASRMVSRLPRRPTRYPSVAELVKRYQDYIPPQGVQELTKTALAPGIPVSESEQEGAVTTSYRPRVRSKQHYLSKKSSTSDFEQGYAANAAPRYINYARRPQGQVAGSSRIPGPYLPASFDSRPSSRRSSPDKRPMYSRVHSDSTVRVGRLSPPSGRPQPAGPFMPRSNRIRSVSRATMKEKAPSVRSTASGNKSTLRRQTRSGTIVSMMRHFERINRETERANRRYAVIRGKRARPVTFERAKLQILDSIKDVIKDESESSDSSEADDEGDDEDEAPEMEQKAGSGAAPVAMQPTPDANPEDGPIQQAEVVTTQPPSTSAEVQQEIDTQIVTVPEEPKPLPFTPSIPPSPAIFPSQIAASPPDLELGTERNSILKALSGFWPQPLPPVRQLEAEDPLSDPEHIFRDSSMVVRTDEPTSVIALALK